MWLFFLYSLLEEILSLATCLCYPFWCGCCWLAVIFLICLCYSFTPPAPWGDRRPPAYSQSEHFLCKACKTQVRGQSTLLLYPTSTRSHRKAKVSRNNSIDLLFHTRHLVSPPSPGNELSVSAYMWVGVYTGTISVIYPGISGCLHRQWMFGIHPKRTGSRTDRFAGNW